MLSLERAPKSRRIRDSDDDGSPLIAVTLVDATNGGLAGAIEDRQTMRSPWSNFKNRSGGDKKKLVDTR